LKVFSGVAILFEEKRTAFALAEPLAEKRLEEKKPRAPRRRRRESY